ncbi:Cardiolipin synthase B [Kordia antarctica]|uniref:Cardiolipin synthase B n=1 Tax=Kordia antarctica TaxID=1218801 RepID=A0A7L4ZIN4_9FLAO|nr:phospholipase D-like domain-containing protein [Kordia antarctica]QHI36598.1 Cardiolipin synthase B [Kordia antarctica]
MLFKEDENITLIHSGDEYFIKMKEIIKNAKEEIHLQTYIFENDETGKDIASCLKEAAHRNVKVYILLDAYGSASLTDDFIQDLQQSGIFFRLFSSLFSLNNFYLGRRMHHKVIVADAKTAMIGGINIGNKYHGEKDNEPWLDYAIKLDCPAAQDLQKLCLDYFFKDGSSKKIKTVLHSAGKTLVGIRQNDWLKNKTEVCDAYTNSINQANKEIVIVSSYFLPGKRLTNAIIEACKRKVKVTLILAGISDVPLIRNATSYLYSLFLKQNVLIYEWDNSVVHGKAAVVDNKWSTIGSFNLNDLSCYGSIEMNVEIHSQIFATTLLKDFENVIEKSNQITFTNLKKKISVFNKLKNWLAYYIVRAAMRILTFLPHIKLLEN